MAFCSSGLVLLTDILYVSNLNAQQKNKTAFHLKPIMNGCAAVNPQLLAELGPRIFLNNLFIALV